MRIYKKPVLTEYGPVQEFTARLGSSDTGDLFYTFKGIIEDTGSRNTCEFDFKTNSFPDNCPDALQP